MAYARFRSRDHLPSFGQLLGSPRYARTASMRADTNENLPQRNAELKGRQFAVTIKRHTSGFFFFNSNEKFFYELQL